MALIEMGERVGGGGLEKVGESDLDSVGKSLEFESQIKVYEISQIHEGTPPPTSSLTTPCSASVREVPPRILEAPLDPTLSYSNVGKLALSNQINASVHQQGKGSSPKEDREEKVGRKVLFNVEEDVMAENGHQGGGGTKQNESPSGNKAKGKGFTPKKPPGSLMHEVRKMSLASQDALQEKKRAREAGGNGNGNGNRVVDPGAISDEDGSLRRAGRRFRKKKKKIEEEYTDKDRAAAVTLALELQPTHKAALVARSQCHLKLGDAESALKDAETSFEDQSAPETYIMGLYWYAEAQYNLGQFERALIAYHRGYRLRRDMEGFRIGIQKAQEAIRRAIGDRSATQIEDLDAILPMIDEMEALKNQNKEHCSIRPGTDEEMLRKRFGVGQPSKARARWVAREVLGQMYLDKDYLTKFLNRPDIQSDHGAAQELRGNATEALNYLEIREQFWRQQNPMYARKAGLNYNNNMVTQYEDIERERMEATRRIKMDAAEGAVLKNISLIEHALSIGRAKDCQLECERTLRQMKDMSVRLLPRKPEFVCQILHYKGLALMKQKKFNQAGDTFQEELNLATDHHMQEAKGRALDYLAKSLALKGSYTEAAEVWETRMAIAKSPLERSYLFHEIARAYLEANKIDIARFYASQGVEEAGKISDAIWTMNAHILLGQIEIKTMALEVALEHFEAALEACKKVEYSAVMQRMLSEGVHSLRHWIEVEAAKAEAGEEEEEEQEFEDSESIPTSDVSLTSEKRVHRNSGPLALPLEPSGSVQA